MSQTDPASRKTRVLFLLAGPRENASSRYRVLNYLPGLRQAGFTCTVLEPLPAILRGLHGLEFGWVPGKAIYYGLFLLSRLLAVLRACRYDVVVVQRDLFPFSAGLMERFLCRLQPAVVYDLDDAMYLSFRNASKSIFQRLRPLRKFDEFLAASAHVVAANEPIREHAASLNDRVSIVPMTIDSERYRVARPAPATGAPLVLGWTGTAASFRYLDALRQPLEALSQDTPLSLEIVSGSKEPLSLGTVPIRRIAWKAATEVEDLSHFDVGLLPLYDDEFERAKTPFKLLQYMALGLPVVASPIGVVPSLLEGGRCGMLATTAADWETCLRTLARDPDLRRTLGERARSKLEAEFATAAFVPVWGKILDEVARGKPGPDTRS